MKIKSIEVDNHPVLGTFIYAFESDKPTTLLVGKNGSGKTIFMEFLHTLLDNGFRVWELPEWNTGTILRIKLSVQLEEFERTDLTQIEIKGQTVRQSLGSGDIYFEATKKTQGWNDFEIFMLNSDGVTYVEVPAEFKHSLAKDKPLSKILRDKSRYSGVQINFGYNPVTSFSDIVDDDQKIQTKSNPSLSDEINKLLVSTYYRDKVEASQKYEDGEIDPTKSRYKGDFDRFKDAYAELFQSKEIVRVQADGTDNKIILRDKISEKEFGIEGLSSGEQQVVYRVGYLLKHLNVKNGGVVFIDEPELSLHPKWQEGYIPFLYKIFGDDIQFVIATHSPYIVKSGIDDIRVSISKLFTVKGNLADEKLHHTSKLGRSTFAEVNYKAFELPSEEFHTELYLALQRTLSPEKWNAGKLNKNGNSDPKYTGGTPTSLDKVLKTKSGITNFPQWTDVNSGGKIVETLMTYIRNIINHGDDAIQRGRGRKYTPKELKQSIDEMLNLL